MVVKRDIALPDSATLTRRRLLELGGALGLSFASTRPACATTPVASKSIRSCILIFYYGGPSHLDTLDPKPNAPAEIRGEYGTIATAVPGIRVCEHLPRVARVMDRVALVRSLHHPMRNHNSAAAEALTGRTPAGGDQELLTDDPRGMPTLGSAVGFALGARANMPALRRVAVHDLQRRAIAGPDAGPARRRATTASRSSAIRARPTSASRPSTGPPT